MARNCKRRGKRRLARPSQSRCPIAPTPRLLRCEHLEDRRMLSAVTVNTHLDTVNFADGVTSLREAIFATNLVGGADTIDFDASLAGKTILLTMGELAITDSLTINGLGADQLTIDARGNDPTPDSTPLDEDETDDGDGSRVFNIDNGNSTSVANVMLTDLYLTGGDVEDDGGAILSHENLTLTNSAVADNMARSGGGISLAEDDATTAISGSTISDNSAEDTGGGISADGIVTIVESTISQNAAGDFGGGVGIFDQATISGSTISDNSAGRFGGGIFSRGSEELAISNTSISRNSAFEEGGGIWSNRRVTISGSTIAQNTASVEGGGIWAGTLTIDDSLVANNSSGRDGGGIWGFNLAITESTITENFAANNGGGIRGGGLTMDGSTVSNNVAEGAGGGIWSSGGPTSTIANSTISGNSAGFVTTVNSTSSTGVTSGSHYSEGVDQGGGVWVDEFMLITHSTISDNKARGEGGGVFSQIRSSVTIVDSSISGNSAGGAGGGVYGSFSANVTIRESTISGNAASSGAGVWSNPSSHPTIYGRATIIQSTISGNTATATGGGVWFSGETAILSSTITGNSADTAGGLFVASGTAAIDHTIVAENSAIVGRDLAGVIGVILDVHFSLIGHNDSSGFTEAPIGSPDANGNLIGGPIHGIIDPMLGPLADNGGPTLTHALLPGSPAIDAGDPSLLPGVDETPEFDQRGAPFGRVVGGRIDIGAYEVQPAEGIYHGDFDGDGDRDGLDFLRWQRGFGKISGATSSDGDATGDGDVDGNDRAVWEATFGGELSAFSSQLSAGDGLVAQRRAELVDLAVAAEGLFDRVAIRQPTATLSRTLTDFQSTASTRQRNHPRDDSQTGLLSQAEPRATAASDDQDPTAWDEEEFSTAALDKVFAQL